MGPAELIAAAEGSRRRMTDATVEHDVDGQRRSRAGARVLLGSCASSRWCPAIAVLFVVGHLHRARRSSPPRTSQHRQFSAALGMVVVAESLILLTGSFDLSLQSIYGLAPMVGAWLIVPRTGTAWAPTGTRRSASWWCSRSAPPSASSTASWS